MGKKKKQQQPSKGLIIVIVIVVLLVIAAAAVIYFVPAARQKAMEIYESVTSAHSTPQTGNNAADNGTTPATDTGTADKSDVSAQTGEVVLQEGDLSFHFLTLGNKYTGDSTYVKIGDVDILIDAGSRQNSAETIVSYVSQYCTDGKLEYVIATHAHQDHIAGFVGLSGKQNPLTAFEVGTIIDFARTNYTSESDLYMKYCTARDAAVTRGAKHYTALECWNNAGDGAQRSYTLSEGVTMDVLYNYYYENSSSDENNYSVCVMFNYGENHYLFTGDLEKEGEKKLVENNALPHCTLYKGGHHGSYTASTEVLMNTIDPDVVCVCCCCGSTEYTKADENTFPSQAFFNRVLPHTDKIYVTTIVTADGEEAGANYPNGGGAKDMNGTIVVVANATSAATVTCSSSATPAPYTAWFEAHRTWPEGVKEKYTVGTE